MTKEDAKKIIDMVAEKRQLAQVGTCAAIDIGTAKNIIDMIDEPSSYICPYSYGRITYPTIDYRKDIIYTKIMGDSTNEPRQSDTERT